MVTVLVLSQRQHGMEIQPVRLSVAIGDPPSHLVYRAEAVPGGTASDAAGRMACYGDVVGRL